MASSHEVIVVGGGLAGLVAARHLSGGGASVTLYERRDTVGGRVRTPSRNQDGFRLDRGFQVLFSSYPAVGRELDANSLSFQRFANGAIVARPGERIPIVDPLRQPRALPTAMLSPALTVGDKLRLARLRLRLSRTDSERSLVEPDQSIRVYLRENGFSDRFIETVAAPFYGGITLDRSLETSTRVLEHTVRALATGHAVVPAAGMGAISAQLATSAEINGATIESSAAVEAIDATADGASVVVDGTTQTADAVVVATDPRSARSVTGVDAIPTTARSCVTQWFSLPADVGLETGRRLLLNAESDGPNHVAPYGEVVPASAPEGVTVFAATYLGGSTATDEDLAERTRETIRSWYPERSLEDLEHQRTDRIEFAQFAQPPGIHDRLPDARTPKGRCYLAGEYTRWSSIQGAMASGRDAAKAVVEDLSREQRRQ